MPDDYHAPMPRRNPEDIDLGAIKADLEFLIEWVTRFCEEQALKPVYTMIGSAAIGIAWIELFWRHCLLSGDCALRRSSCCCPSCVTTRCCSECRCDIDQGMFGPLCDSPAFGTDTYPEPRDRGSRQGYTTGFESRS